jgi:hypothetical protein
VQEKNTVRTKLPIKKMYVFTWLTSDCQRSYDFFIGASTIYFISGKTSDGIFLAAAIILIAVISSYQKLEVTTL